MSNSYQPLKHDPAQQRRPRKAFVILASFAFGTIAVCLALFLVWAAHYWASNTPFKGQFTTPPVPSAKFVGTLACFSVPLGCLSALIAVVLAREAFRHD